MGRPENVHRTHISRFRYLCGPSGQNGQTIGFINFYGLFETNHDPLSAIPCPLGTNVNSWDALGASREPTFPLNTTCVGTMGILGIPLASPIFCCFFETIHDPLSAIPCPLGPNVNSWDGLGASREPTFPLNTKCVGTMGRLGIPLASPILCRFFETIHDLLSALPCPLGQNVNRWAALKTSTEATFPVFVTCVRPVGRMGKPLASSVFYDFLKPFTTISVQYPAP